MTATTIAAAQKNLAQLVADVNDGCTQIIIVNDNGKNHYRYINPTTSMKNGEITREV